MSSDQICNDIFGESSFTDAESEVYLSSLALAVLVFGLAFIPFCLFYFVKHRGRHEHLRKRSLLLQGAFLIGVTIFLVNFCYRAYIGHSNFSCSLLTYLSIIDIELIYFSQAIRALRVLARIKLNKKLIDKLYDKYPDSEFVSSSNGADNTTIANSSRDAPKSQIATADNTAAVLVSNRKILDRKKSFCEVFKIKFYCFLYKLTCWSVPHNLDEDLIISYYRCTLNFALLLLILAISSISLVVFFINMDIFTDGFGCFGCTTAYLSGLFFPLVAAGTLTAGYLVYAMWRIPDSFGIKRELTVSFFVLVIIHGGFNYALSNFIFTEAEDEGKWDFFILSSLALLFLCFYFFILQVWLADRRSRIVDLDDFEVLLKSKSGSKAFAVHLANSLALENLQFLQMQQKWTNSYNRHPRAIIIQKTKDICEQFINDEGVFAINISGELRESILETVFQTPDNISITLLDECVAEVKRMLQAQYNSFVETKIYKLYKNDIQDVAEFVEE